MKIASEKIIFLEPPVVTPPQWRERYPLWGLFFGGLAGILVVHPLFMVTLHVHEYIYHQAPLVLGQAILESFGDAAWPMILLFALFGAAVGAAVGILYRRLQRNRRKLESIHEDFELQVASLRHHYKNLAIGIQGFAHRVKRKLAELEGSLKEVCFHRECPGYFRFQQEFHALEGNVAILEGTAQSLSTTLRQEVQFLRALASDCLTPEPQDFYQILMSSIQDLQRFRFRAKDFKVEINDQPWEGFSESLSFPFDPYAMAVVLQNILSNAMKYGDHIQVQVSDRKHQVHMEIRDNGPGLEVQKLKKSLMTPPQGDSESTKLGLRVTLYLLTKCGGRLGVWSEPGSGATFFMSFPKHTGLHG